MSDRHDPGPLPSIGIVNCMHCSATFQIPPPVIGGQPQQNYAMLFAELSTHLKAKHRNLKQVIDGQFAMFAINFTTMVVGSHFSSLDDGFEQYRDQARSWVHRLTQRVKIADETIDDKVKQLQLSSIDEQQVATILKWLRDLYEEKTDLQTASSPILVS
jgi:hypothetical protein